MGDIDRSSPVMVTGATGYVAGQLIRLLLSEGIKVHAALRDPQNTQKLKFLKGLQEEFSTEIKFFKADLLSEDSYLEAMDGCSVVFHTASPFVLHVKDPQRDLVDPAVMGTRNILNSVNKTKSVRRVVLTSSCAAIYGDSIDILNTRAGIFTEEYWNTTSSLEHNPYSLSKTLAEKEAWEIAKKQSEWELLVINPSLVMGPGINPFATSESFNIMKQMVDGTYKAGVPDWSIGVVDVRDVAQAHFNAAYLNAPSGRYMTSGHNVSFLDLAKSLEPKYGDKYPLPKKTLPKFLIWLFGPLMEKALTRKIVSRNVGYPWKGDNSKSREILRVRYRPVKETMEDFLEQLIKYGVINE